MLNFEFLELGRLRSDLIFCYNIFTNLVAVEPAVAFQYRHTTSLPTRSSYTHTTPSQNFCVLLLSLNNTTILIIIIIIIIIHIYIALVEMTIIKLNRRHIEYSLS